MEIALLILLGLVVIVVTYCIVTYNGLVQVKHAVTKAWANTDVLLKQRHDELPELVEVCKQYRQFAHEILERLIEARERVRIAREAQDIPALNQAEGPLRAGLGQVFALAEAYPDLKTNENYMQLQRRISALEDGIADRRELYNEAANINNVRIEEFPASIIAGMFHFVTTPLLEVTGEERAHVDVKALFG
jgi:LemA protein